jgi:hypothetical protein
MQIVTKSTTLELHNLAPEPAEEWVRLLSFVGLTDHDKRAMSATVQVLMRRATELVDTYNYLLTVPETAVILGWETGADEKHLNGLDLTYNGGFTAPIHPNAKSDIFPPGR